MTGKTKPWYASKTVWAIILTMAIMLGDSFGVQPVDRLPDSLNAVMEIVLLVIATWGRLVARQQLR